MTICHSRRIGISHNNNNDNSHMAKFYFCQDYSKTVVNDNINIIVNIYLL